LDSAILLRGEESVLNGMILLTGLKKSSTVITKPNGRDYIFTLTTIMTLGEVGARSKYLLTPFFQKIYCVYSSFL